MEPQQEIFTEGDRVSTSFWNTVTPLSKYLAMVLFVVLPFVGGYIGYKFAPEKIVEVEKIVETEVESKEVSSTSLEKQSGVSTYVNDEFGFLFDYPAKYGELKTDLFPGNKQNSESLLRIRSADGNTFVAILYGTNYMSEKTGSFDSPVCTNEKYKDLQIHCADAINAAGTTYHEIDLDEIYSGPGKRLEFYVNEDFSLLLMDWHDVEIKNLIVDSFALTTGN